MLELTPKITSEYNERCKNKHVLNKTIDGSDIRTHHDTDIITIRKVHYSSALPRTVAKCDAPETAMGALLKAIKVIRLAASGATAVEIVIFAGKERHGVLPLETIENV